SGGRRDRFGEDDRRGREIATPVSQVPPQNIEAEETVLGAMLVSEPAVNRVIDDVRLKAGDFYLDRHRSIYGVMLELYGSDKPCDQLTVNEALDGAGLLDEVGGKNYVFELSAKVSAPG